MKYYMIGRHIIDLDSIIHVENRNWSIGIYYPNQWIEIKFDNHNERNEEFAKLWLAIKARNNQM